MIRCFLIFFQASFWIANLFGSSNPLPDNFIKQVIENSDDIRANKDTRERITRKDKRKVLHQLANRKIKTSTRKKDDA